MARPPYRPPETTGRGLAAAKAAQTDSQDRAPAVDPAVSDTSTVAGSGQATLRHTGGSAESCFLPDLTRFAGPRCAGPGHLRCVRAELLKLVGPRAGIQPPIRGFGVQGTTSSPPSTVQHPC